MIHLRDENGRIVLQGSVELRFWSKVDKNGPVPAHRPALGPCWIWTSTISKQRGMYGLFKLVSGEQVRAHRFAFKLTHGEIPDGAQVLHHCDNPPCVRPEHLFAGTNADNMADKQAKGRQVKGDRQGLRLHPERVPRGERNANAKLTADLVREIRRRAAAGESQRTLAIAFQVHPSAIRSVVIRKSWKHVA